MNFEADITGVAFGGKGIARVEGKVWFVKGTVPGDRVRVKPLESKDNFGEGEAEAFLTRSPLRQEIPPCPVFGQCGGCQWQDIPYSTQLEWKRSFLVDSLRRIGKIEADFTNILPSPEQWHYRSRILIRVHVDLQGQVAFGFFKGETRELVSISQCHIASQGINRFLTFLSDLRLPENAGETFRLEIQELGLTGSSKLWITVFPSLGRKQNLEPALKQIRTHEQTAWVGSSFELGEVSPELFESDLGVDFYATPGQFQQVNLAHNQTLRRLVQDLITELGINRVLDVFCGSGNLSLPLTGICEEVSGVELNPRSIENAKVSAKRNAIDNTHWVAGDGVKYLIDLVKQRNSSSSSGSKGAEAPIEFDGILLDPPREGFFKGLSSLIGLNPKFIIYVSCDPVTLARDLGWLTKNGYNVERITCLDFFPNTYHVESLTVLRRRDLL
jgi:23S rRNA (uracil1939-C5)-methyltransferase